MPPLFSTYGIKYHTGKESKEYNTQSNQSEKPRCLAISDWFVSYVNSLMSKKTIKRLSVSNHSRR